MKTTRLLTLILAGLCALALLPQCKKEVKKTNADNRATETPIYPDTNVLGKEIYGKWQYDASLDRFQNMTKSEWDTFAGINQLFLSITAEEETTLQSFDFVDHNTVKVFENNDFTEPRQTLEWGLFNGIVFFSGQSPNGKSDHLAACLVSVEEGKMFTSVINKRTILARFRMAIEQLTLMLNDPSVPQKEKDEIKMGIEQVQAASNAVDKLQDFAIWRGHKRP